MGGYVVVFGGTQGKHFHADTVVLDARALSDVKRARWFRPTPAKRGCSVERICCIYFTFPIDLLFIFDHF